MTGRVARFPAAPIALIGVLAAGCRSRPSASADVPLRGEQQLPASAESPSLLPAVPRTTADASTVRPPASAGSFADVSAGPFAGPFAGPSAGPSAGPFADDPQNRHAPESEGADLDRRAKALFVAITSGDPAAGDDFFFPRAPFLPLKDVADPGRYFRYLLNAYHHDIADARARHRDWSRANYVGFSLGSRPTWVAPGREYNRIGYYRTYGGKLEYEISGRRETIDVHVLITYAGRWYITHLGAIHH